MTSKRSFVWDPEKALGKISFEVRTTAFEDPFAIQWVNDRRDYGERRMVTTGMIDGRKRRPDPTFPIAG